MNPFEQVLRDMTEKAERKNRFGHLTKEQRVEKTMECNRVFWEHVTFTDPTTIDQRGIDMQSLINDLRTMDMAGYHVDHNLINENEASRKESEMRCKFWNKHNNMTVAAIAYAEYCGYITYNAEAADMEIAAIEAKYEAMKPRDGESVRAEGPTENADDNE